MCCASTIRGHILLEAAWEDAATGLLDIRRLGEFLRRIKGRIRYKALDHVSPLAVPVLLGDRAGAGQCQGRGGRAFCARLPTRSLREAIARGLVHA